MATEDASRKVLSVASGRWHPSYCRHCKGTVEEVGHISATGKCFMCGLERKQDNIEQLHYHSGPWFDHWLARCRAAFGMTAVDAPQDRA